MVGVGSRLFKQKRHPLQRMPRAFLSACLLVTLRTLSSQRFLLNQRYEHCYTEDDFKALLTAFKGMEGKFMLSSYPSPVLSAFIAKNGWKSEQFSMKVAVTGIGKKPKKDKVEVITYNY